MRCRKSIYKSLRKKKRCSKEKIDKSCGEYIYIYIYEIVVNLPFPTNVSHLYPLIISENSGFLMFSGVIEESNIG